MNHNVKNRTFNYHHSLYQLSFAYTGADVNESTVSYLSPLGLAIARNNTSISELLIAHGSVLPTVKCSSLGYPLLLAVDKGNVELVEIALAAGSKFVHGPYQTCPLVSSVRRNDVTMVKLLLTAPRCNSGTCRYYETILHDALFAHNAFDAACLLLESKQFGFEFRSVNLLFILLGMTAELRFRHSRIGHLLLKYGADIAFFSRHAARNQTPSMCFMWHQRARTRNKRFQNIVRMLLLVGILPQFSERLAIDDVDLQT